MQSMLYVFADLDDTLFTTASKIPVEQQAESVRVTDASNGNHSFTMEKHKRLLEWINPLKLIPVTARGSDAFSRVDAAYKQGPFSIIANGAVILDAAGTPNEKWSESVKQILAPNQDIIADLPKLMLRIADNMDADVRTWNVEEGACGSTYCVVKSNMKDNGACLQQVEAEARRTLNEVESFRIHRNGNNLAILPPGISKALATRFVIAELSENENVTCVGVGDSLSDLEFMKACDFWMTPSHSQLDNSIKDLS